MILEYRVVWKRTDGRKYEKRFATLKGAQRKVLRLGPEPWLASLERDKRDPDALWCCSGYQCPCGGQTVRQNWAEFMAKHPPIEYVRIESRSVGSWTDESVKDSTGEKR